MSCSFDWNKILKFCFSVFILLIMCNKNILRLLSIIIHSKNRMLCCRNTIVLQITRKSPKVKHVVFRGLTQFRSSNRCSSSISMTKKSFLFCCCLCYCYVPAFTCSVKGLRISNFLTLMDALNFLKSPLH